MAEEFEWRLDAEWVLLTDEPEARRLCDGTKEEAEEVGDKEWVECAAPGASIEEGLDVLPEFLVDMVLGCWKR